MEYPHPVTATICSICQLPWDRHLTIAADYDENGEKSYRAVELEDCIWLLQHVNQGPMGPPGPQGPKGATVVVRG